MTADLGYDDPLTAPPTSVRQLLADALRERLVLDEVKVVDHADAVTPEKDRDLVMVLLDEVQPGRYSGARHLKARVVVATARTIPGQADDDIEARAAKVLDALDTVPWLMWTSAKRTTYQVQEDAPVFPAFSIDCEIEAH
jgi:hypothetical protein